MDTAPGADEARLWRRRNELARLGATQNGNSHDEAEYATPSNLAAGTRVPAARRAAR